MYFSICIPTYNRAHTLLRTLESVKDQKFSSYEVLIVDDGSKDGTKELVKKYLQENCLEDRFRYIYKENGGKHTALNVGIQEAQGEFFIILDSDDWLVEDALENLYAYCEQIKENESFCGVMGKSLNSETNEMIGDLFDLTNPISSYFEYHFIMPQKMKVNDCFEANKTKLLKQFTFPEEEGMKFVPEAWLFDQLGVNYKLLLTNDIFRNVEYLSEGMTRGGDLREKQYRGFLYHYISRIENVLDKIKLPFKLKIKLYTLAWYRYWQCVAMDKEKKGPRIKKVSLFGRFVWICKPFIQIVFKT